MATLRHATAALLAAFALIAASVTAQEEPAPAAGPASPVLAFKIMVTPSAVEQGGEATVVAFVGSPEATITIFATGPNGEGPDCTPPIGAQNHYAGDRNTGMFQTTCLFDRLGTFDFNGVARQMGSPEASSQAEVTVTTPPPASRCMDPEFDKIVSYKRACEGCTEVMDKNKLMTAGMRCQRCCGVCGDGRECCSSASLRYSSAKCQLAERHVRFDKCRMKMVCTKK